MMTLFKLLKKFCNTHHLSNNQINPIVEFIRVNNLQKPVIEFRKTSLHNGMYVSGISEMVGKRPTMEDITIVIDNFPSSNSIFFGLFDGHGGQEAATFASEKLPKINFRRKGFKKCIRFFTTKNDTKIFSSRYNSSRSHC